jgi:hypothetical protein
VALPSAAKDAYLRELAIELAVRSIDTARITFHVATLDIVEWLGIRDRLYLFDDSGEVEVAFNDAAAKLACYRAANVVSDRGTIEVYYTRMTPDASHAVFLALNASPSIHVGVQPPDH